MQVILFFVGLLISVTVCTPPPPPLSLCKGYTVINASKSLETFSHDVSEGPRCYLITVPLYEHIVDPNVEIRLGEDDIRAAIYFGETLQGVKEVGLSYNIERRSPLMLVFEHANPQHVELVEFDVAAFTGEALCPLKTFDALVGAIVGPSFTYYPYDINCTYLIDPHMGPITIYPTNLTSDDLILLYMNSSNDEPDFSITSIHNNKQIELNGGAFRMIVKWVFRSRSHSFPWTLQYNASRDVCSTAPIIYQESSQKLTAPPSPLPDDTCLWIIAPPDAWEISVTIEDSSETLQFHPGSNFDSEYPLKIQTADSLSFAAPLGISYIYDCTKPFSISYHSSNQRPSCFHKFEEYLGSIASYEDEQQDCYYFINNTAPFVLLIEFAEAGKDAVDAYLQVWPFATPRVYGTTVSPGESTKLHFNGTALIKSTAFNAQSPNIFTLTVQPIELFNAEPEAIIIVGTAIASLVAALTVALIVLFAQSLLG